VSIRATLAELDLTSDERSFRSDVVALLRQTEPTRERMQFFRGRGGVTADLYRAIGERDWFALTWPTEIGGAGRSAMYEFLLWDEMAYARAARAPVGAGLVARSIVEWGTDEQRARFLPGIRTGAENYSLGYSEPEAGSDLTGLRTRAVRDGDVYRVTGEKRWTSDAHNAEWLWLLCRTGEQHDRSKGLSLLIVSTASPGITMTPIRTIDGHRLNEVRLDEVEVPVSHRIGGEGDAWSMIRRALARERHLQVLPGRIERDLESLLALLDRDPDVDPDRARAEVARLTARSLAVRTSAVRALRRAGHDEIDPVIAARNKVHGTALMQDIARTAFRLGCREAVVEGEDVQLLWRESIMETIAGGTTEVMLDLIARHGLPKECAG
jgi:alkylation response protein AidB-like acyl-CoA dehydrogenase